MAKRVIDDALRAQLRHVRIPAEMRAVDRFPDFLIVGPQRTGTTWLHAHLRYHPQVFLAEPKELFFWSGLENRSGDRFRSDRLDWYIKFFRDPAWRTVLKNALCLWKWGERYRPIVRGEATASYATLDREIIREIAILNPDVKAILMIRDPVDRAWSHAKKDLLRKTGRRLEDVSEGEFTAFFTDDYQRRCARYVEHCDNWSSYLRDGHLFVRPFDAIAKDPETLLLDVMGFLGVAAERRYVGHSVRESVNPTIANEIPDKYDRFLRELFLGELLALNERFGLTWPKKE